MGQHLAPRDRRLALLVAACALGLVAAAPNAPAPKAKVSEPASERVPWAKPYVGRWSLSGVSEGDPVCELVLADDMVIGGAHIDVSATCRRNYPLEDVAGWTVMGKSITLIDAIRKPVIAFMVSGDGSYGSAFKDGRAVSLERGPPDRPASLRALFDEGTFTLSGPDNAGACGFAVTVKTATGGGLEQDGRCPRAWKARGWSSWSADKDKLTLKDRKGAAILTLTRADQYTFVADGQPAPLFFGPGVIDGSEALEK